MRKQEPVIIRTPPLSTDEFVKILGISPKRRAELERFYQEVVHDLEEEDRRKRARSARAKKSKR
ncbi:MAG TPA: hypothetical protein VG323_19415 [Thermoanaerobaculia bacterium]|nr:hypothetical protein [Thermoanaerobaculia bacterium]